MTPSFRAQRRPGLQTLGWAGSEPRLSLQEGVLAQGARAGAQLRPGCPGVPLVHACGGGEVGQEPDAAWGLGWRQGAGDTHGPVLRGRAGSSARRVVGNQGWAGGMGSHCRSTVGPQASWRLKGESGMSQADR